MESLQTKKPRKKRKPMSAEQRSAAAERLAKAREERVKANPPEYKSVHPDVLKRSDDDPISFKKVKEWIKYQKELRNVYSKDMRRDVKGATAKYYSCNGYINNMENYLRTNIWLNLFYGQDEEFIMKNQCIRLAYYHSGPLAGQPKRCVGTYYPDLGCEWTREMDNSLHGEAKIKKKK